MNFEKLETQEVIAAGNALQFYCHKASYDAGWWMIAGYGGEVVDVRAELLREWVGKDPWDTRLGKAFVAEKLALIHSEISEALEGLRKDKMDEHLPDRKSIEVELADAVIRIADLCGAMNFNLGDAIAAKMAYNLLRPDHKLEARQADGGKAL